MIKSTKFKNPFKQQEQPIQYFSPYMILVTCVLAAWFPALGGHPLFSEEFHYRNMLNNGFFSFCTEWLAFQGMWRLLSQAVNGILTNHPAFCSYLAVFTHIVTVCLFFRVTEILFKRTGISLVLALIVGVFPWGYQTIVNVMGYTPMLATTIFWGNLLLLITFANNKKSQPYVFIISFILTFVAQSLYEILIFAFMFSGIIICIDETNRKISWKNIIPNIRYKYSALAPLLSGLAFLIAYKLTYPIANRMYPPGFNLNAIFSIYFRQYTNYYIFQPWLNPVTRNLIFYSWDLQNTLFFTILLCAFIFAYFVFVKRINYTDTKFPQLNKSLLPYILLLIFGAALLYAIAGGYTVETRKKYSLIPFFVLLIGWVWCNFLENRIQISRKIITLVMTFGLFGVSTSWLVTGVYLYEINRQDALAEFIVTNKIKGDIQIELNPDIKAAWSTMTATLGFDMYDNWVFNFSPEAKLGLWTGRPLADKAWFLHEGERLVNITQNSHAVKLQFDPNQARWQVVSR